MKIKMDYLLVYENAGKKEKLVLEKLTNINSNNYSIAFFNLSNIEKMTIISYINLYKGLYKELNGWLANLDFYINNCMKTIKENDAKLFSEINKKIS